MNETRQIIEKAFEMYEDLIRPYRDDSDSPTGRPEVIAERWRELPVDPVLHDAILYIGACFPAHGGHPGIFSELANNKDWSIGSVVSIGAAWYQYYREDFGYRIPEFVHENNESAILRKVIKEAPDEFCDYITATRKLFYRDLPSTEIEKFRLLWDELPESRREAITIALATDNHFKRFRDEISISPIPSKFDLVTYPTRRPSEVAFRPRWIDKNFNMVRSTLWHAYKAACAEFAQVCDSSGDERGQVSALLESLRLSPRIYVKGLQDLLKSLNVNLALDHYVFSTAEENVWGPDFALLFSYREKNRITLNRYIQFQAKLIKSGSVRIPIDQLAAMLRSSWHSSFYTFWAPGIAPRTISAALLKELIKDSTAATPRKRWVDVNEYTDSFASLIGDRILCAELGDDPNMENASSTKIAHRMAELFGRPRYGVMSVSVQVGGDTDGNAHFGDVLDLDHEKK